MDTSTQSAKAPEASNNACSVSSQPTEMRGARTNFVIPKNKLSGALVPVTRASKWEPIEPKIEHLPRSVSRKTKWAPDLSEDPDVKRRRALALQTRAEQLAAQLESGSLGIDYNEATRSPSPPPVYDSFGHRMNTREARKREQLDIERRDAIGECMKLNPAYKPPPGFRPVLKEAKLYIPVKEYPGYNFIGLILGPRGNTQKHMEAETGARITIRGKGSIKEGKAPVKHSKENDYYEDLHVHISGDTWEKIDAAITLIKPLLTPVDEYRNVHIMKQLRELAEINGTVRDITRFCGICGEMGHRDWQCPKDKLQTFQAKIICRLCGDASHPTFDCPLKISGEGKPIDKEYLNFLEEIGIGQVNAETSSAAGAAQVGTDSTSSESAQSASSFSAFMTRSMAEASAGGGSGGFPRVPFPPPGPASVQFFNTVLPRLFQGMFRGSVPAPVGLAMMARMFAAFGGRFPFPPSAFGLGPNMCPPPIPSTQPEGPLPTPVDNSTNVRFDDKKGDSEQGSFTLNGTHMEGEKFIKPPSMLYGTASEAPSFSPTVSSAIPSSHMAGVASFSSLPSVGGMVPGSSSAMFPPFQPTVAAEAPSISQYSVPNPPIPEASPPPWPPSESPISAPPNPLIPPWPPASVTPIGHSSSMFPVLPSIRPALPSVRPPPPVPVPPQNLGFTPVGGPGLIPPSISVRPVIPSVRPAMPTYAPVGLDATQESSRFTPHMVQDGSRLAQEHSRFTHLGEEVSRQNVHMAEETSRFTQGEAFRYRVMAEEGSRFGHVAEEGSRFAAGASWNMNIDKYHVNTDNYAVGEDRYSLSEDRYPFNMDGYRVSRDSHHLNMGGYAQQSRPPWASSPWVPSHYPQPPTVLPPPSFPSGYAPSLSYPRTTFTPVPPTSVLEPHGNRPPKSYY